MGLFDFNLDVFYGAHVAPPCAIHVLVDPILRRRVILTGVVSSAVLIHYEFQVLSLVGHVLGLFISDSGDLAPSIVGSSRILQFESGTQAHQVHAYAQVLELCVFGQPVVDQDF